MVTAISRLHFNKNTFRATLATIWCLFDVLLISSFLYSGTIKSEEAVTSAALLPFLITALVIGDYCHKKINEKKFRIFIYILIAGAGIALI